MKQIAEHITHLPQQAQQPAEQGGALVTLNPEALIAKGIEHGLPVETMERLLAMRTQLKKEQAREAFNHALASFQADIPPIAKRQTAQVQTRSGGRYSYNYADIADIQRAIAPKLREAGLSLTFDTQQEGGILNVVCIVHHVAGHSERTGFPVPIDQAARMNDAQKVGSALTYGRRYALCAALGIVTAEDDDDAQALHTPPAGEPAGNPRQPPQQPAGNTPTRQAPPGRQNGAPISEAQHRRLEARISELGLDRERVKSWVKRAWGVEHLNQVPADRYNRLDTKLDEWASAEREARDERAAIQAESAA